MIGFLLVFVLAVVALSALAALALAAADGWLRARGPRSERRAVELAALMPTVFALVLVAALVVRGFAGDDHCGVHDHHAHLCAVHGEAWASLPWAVLAVAAAGAAFAARLAVLIGRHLHAARSVAILRRSSVASDGVRVIDSPLAFCFVAGVRRPQIYASTTAWEGLDDDERGAMLAHERGHVAHRDLTWRLAVDALLLFAAPLLGHRLGARWSQATERMRDGEAAAAVGDPEAVARALVRMSRLQRPASAPGLSFVGAAGELTRRVEAVLAGRPDGGPSASSMSRAMVVVLVVAAAAVIGRIDHLHHALESLLG